MGRPEVCWASFGREVGSGARKWTFEFALGGGRVAPGAYLSVLGLLDSRRASRNKQASPVSRLLILGTTFASFFYFVVLQGAVRCSLYPGAYFAALHLVRICKHLPGHLAAAYLLYFSLLQFLTKVLSLSLPLSSWLPRLSE